MSLKEEIIKESKIFVSQNHGLLIDTEGHYNSPRISSEFMDCSMPMTFDHYSHCHPEGTLITMADGSQKPIEELVKRDNILSYSIDKKQLKDSEVIECFKRQVEDLIVIETVNGHTLELTGDHPVFVKSKGWVRAKDLMPDDTVLVLE